MELFKQMLSIDSTSGKEENFALWCVENLKAERLEIMKSESAINLLYSWGDAPKIVFCSHLDTVPPYIAPSFTEDTVYGRGSCDAKGQIYSMYRACKELERKGYSDFALLLLSGEETASFGAKEFAKTSFKAPYLVVGEPTENKIVAASKGTKAFDIHISGTAFHSAYPQFGKSAIDIFVDLCNKLRSTEFPVDPVLGETSWNFGRLHSDNPQNILSPSLDCQLYFRTTFESDEFVCRLMEGLIDENITVKFNYGDKPLEYYTIEGIESTVVSFGSDAPHLANFDKKMICGPGSVLTAHRDDEQIRLSDIETAINNYIKIYETELEFF